MDKYLDKYKVQSTKYKKERARVSRRRAVFPLYFVLSTLYLTVILPAQTPVFRAGTVIIPVDVAVLDKDKRPVTDLEQSDFTVFENGVKQDIRAFFTTELKPDPPPEGTNPTLIRTGDQPTGVAPRKRRTFLFVFGHGPIEAPTEPLRATIDFVREKLLPQDLIAVMAFNRVTDITTDHERVAQVMERYLDRHVAITRKISDFYGMDLPVPGGFRSKPCPACNYGVDIPPEIQSEIDAVFQPVGLAPIAGHMRDALRPLLESSELKQDYRLAIPGMKATSGPWNQWFICGNDCGAPSGETHKVFAGLEYLRAAPGDKHVVFFTNGGIPGLSVQDDVRVAAVASAAQVSIDVIHTAGAQYRDTFAIAAAERVTEMTGGHFTGVNYAKEPLSWIDASTRSGYLLGYTPTNTKIDNKFRRIEVKVNRPDVTVVYRRGYTPEKVLSPAERRAQLVSNRIGSGFQWNQAANDIAIHARASASAGPGRRLLVTATIDASRLSWTMQGTKHVATLDVHVLAGDIKERVIGKEQRTLELSADEETFQRYLKDGIPYSARLTLSSGDPIYAKVLVYDFGADLLGTAYVKLR